VAFKETCIMAIIKEVCVLWNLNFKQVLTDWSILKTRCGNEIWKMYKFIISFIFKLNHIKNSTFDYALLFFLNEKYLKNNKSLLF
jgi:hypothetical protein